MSVFTSPRVVFFLFRNVNFLLEMGDLCLFCESVPCAHQYRFLEQALDCTLWSIMKGKHWTLTVYVLLMQSLSSATKVLSPTDRYCLQRCAAILRSHFDDLAKRVNGDGEDMVSGAFASLESTLVSDSVMESGQLFLVRLRNTEVAIGSLVELLRCVVACEAQRRVARYFCAAYSLAISASFSIKLLEFAPALRLTNELLARVQYWLHSGAASYKFANDDCRRHSQSAASLVARVAQH